jgi:hypothetical protein
MIESESPDYATFADVRGAMAALELRPINLTATEANYMSSRGRTTSGPPILSACHGRHAPFDQGTKVETCLRDGAGMVALCIAAECGECATTAGATNDGILRRPICSCSPGRNKQTGGAKAPPPRFESQVAHSDRLPRRHWVKASVFLLRPPFQPPQRAPSFPREFPSLLLRSTARHWRWRPRFRGRCAPPWSGR